MYDETEVPPSSSCVCSHKSKVLGSCILSFLLLLQLGLPSIFLGTSSSSSLFTSPSYLLYNLNHPKTKKINVWGSQAASLPPQPCPPLLPYTPPPFLNPKVSRFSHLNQATTPPHSSLSKRKSSKILSKTILTLRSSSKTRKSC